MGLHDLRLAREAVSTERHTPQYAGWLRPDDYASTCKNPRGGAGKEDSKSHRERY